MAANNFGGGNAAASHDPLVLTIKREKHINFLRTFLDQLPAKTTSLDTTRLMVVFFAISGLELLNALDQVCNRKDKSAIIDWIYAQQIVKPKAKGHGAYGFRGSGCNGQNHTYDFGHLAMTYTAMATLLILEDDFSRLNRTEIVNGIKELQLESGSFAAVYGSESDMRFVYCAATICYMLDDWSAIDVDKAVEFIANSLSYEGGFGQGPGHEAHGGSTYCAVASLILMNKLDLVLNGGQTEKLKRWCINRQTSGFQGRPNKDADTCYSFWIGATLKLLGSYELVNVKENVEFVLTTEDIGIGGLAKYPDSFPDILHTYLGLSGLALINNSGRNILDLLDVNPTLNIPEKAGQRLKHLLAANI